jgi:hypothetical protein
MSTNFDPSERGSSKRTALVAILGAGFGVVVTLAGSALWHGPSSAQVHFAAMAANKLPTSMPATVTARAQAVALPLPRAADPSDLETTERSIANYDH